MYWLVGLLDWLTAGDARGTGILMVRCCSFNLMMTMTTCHSKCTPPETVFGDDPPASGPVPVYSSFFHITYRSLDTASSSSLWYDETEEFKNGSETIIDEDATPGGCCSGRNPKSSKSFHVHCSLWSASERLVGVVGALLQGKQYHCKWMHVFYFTLSDVLRAFLSLSASHWWFQMETLTCKSPVCLGRFTKKTKKWFILFYSRNEFYCKFWRWENCIEIINKKNWFLWI